MKRKTVAVTGGIGSGKSTVIRILQDLGFQTLDCDSLAKEVSLKAETVNAVSNLLGKQYLSNGQLNRKAIREKIFADDALLSQYNKIFFDGVYNALIAELERLGKLSDGKSCVMHKNSADNAVFVEISVFDAFDFAWDAVWLVECDTDTRIRRVTERDKVTETDTKNIIAHQNVTVNYTLKIQNDGDENLLKQKVLCAINKTFEQ